MVSHDRIIREGVVGVKEGNQLWIHNDSFVEQNEKTAEIERKIEASLCEAMPKELAFTDKKNRWNGINRYLFNKDSVPKEMETIERIVTEKAIPLFAQSMLNTPIDDDFYTAITSKEQMFSEAIEHKQLLETIDYDGTCISIAKELVSLLGKNIQKTWSGAHGVFRWLAEKKNIAKTREYLSIEMRKNSLAAKRLTLLSKQYNIFEGQA